MWAIAHVVWCSVVIVGCLLAGSGAALVASTVALLASSLALGWRFPKVAWVGAAVATIVWTPIALFGIEVPASDGWELSEGFPRLLVLAAVCLVVGGVIAGTWAGAIHRLGQPPEQ